MKQLNKFLSRSRFPNCATVTKLGDPSPLLAVRATCALLAGGKNYLPPSHAYRPLGWNRVHGPHGPSPLRYACFDPMSWASKLNVVSRKRGRPRRIDAIRMAELPLSEPSRFESVVASGANTVRREIELKAPGFLDELPAGTATMAVATLLCQALKPYGTGSLPDLPSMLAAATLDCSNFGLLALHVSRVLAADIDTDVKVHFVGWQSEAIGNHQMLFAAMRGTGEGALVLDPAVGVIAKGTFDWVASQRPLPPSKILAFHQQTFLDSSRNQVVEALIQGLLKPSELLYYFESEEHLVNRFGAPIDWPTPGAIPWRRKYLQVD